MTAKVVMKPWSNNRLVVTFVLKKNIIRIIFSSSLLTDNLQVNNFLLDSRTSAELDSTCYAWESKVTGICKTGGVHVHHSVQLSHQSQRTQEWFSLTVQQKYSVAFKISDDLAINQNSWIKIYGGGSGMDI